MARPLDDRLFARLGRWRDRRRTTPRPKSTQPSRRLLLAGVSVLALSGLVASTTPASAIPAGQTAKLPTLAKSTQFDITGFMKSAKVDCSQFPSLSGKPALCGGTAVINGKTIVIPAETIVILPASALTWAELFTLAPAPYGPTQTGMALDDSPPAPSTTYEVHVVGNRVIDPVGANGCATTSVGYVAATNSCDRHIAGLVHISQQDLNTGAGYINFIHYDTGEVEVGGQLNVANTGARVQINDPTGRFGRAMSPDPRFGVDQDNPTILAETGYPMCVPRIDPNIGQPEDALCPQENRPLSTGLKDPISGQQHPPAGQFDTFFTMDDPANCTTLGSCLDPRLQAPFEIGDYVNFSGTLVKDGGRNGAFISAHTIVASLGIYTAAGTNPAYVSIDVSLIGTGGLTIFGAGEAAIRTRFEGMTTDPSRNVHVYGIDIDPTTGKTTDRDFGTIGVDPGPTAGAVKGRWRLRPPCTVTTATQKACTPPPAGSYLPPPREVRAVVEGLQGQDPQNAPIAQTSANGIFYGQYHAPVDEYIFPENVPGLPVPENNFNSMSFLAFGGYQSSTSVMAGVLRPWPSNVLPVKSVCATPNAGGPYTVANGGGTVTLTGTAGSGLTGTVSYSWGPPSKATGTLSTNVGATTVYKSGTVSTLPFSEQVVLTVTQLNAGGCPTQVTSTATVNYGENAFQPVANAPKFTSTKTLGTTSVGATLDPLSPVTVTLTDTGTFKSPAPTADVKFTGRYQFSQIGGPAVTWLNNSNGFSASVTCTIRSGTTSCQAPTGGVAFTLPAGSMAAANNPLKFTARLILTSTSVSVAGLTMPLSSAASAPLSIQVLPNGITQNIGLTTVQYRTGNNRLDITATYTGADANVAPTGILKLQPYLTEAGAIYDPAVLGNTFTNTGGGVYTLTLVGAPPPYCGNPSTYATPCVTPSNGPGVVVVAFAAPTATRVKPNSFEGFSAPIGTALTDIR